MRHFGEVKTLWLVLTTSKGRLRVKKVLGLRFEFCVGSGQGKGVIGLNVKGGECIKPMKVLTKIEKQRLRSAHVNVILPEKRQVGSIRIPPCFPQYVT